MELELIHLDESNVRQHMLAEYELDTEDSSLYTGSFLNQVGSRVWPERLREGLAQHDPTWLAETMSEPTMWRSTYTQNRATGPVEARVPSNAPSMLADGEFGRFYIRAVCREALSRGESEVEVTRLRVPSKPRPQSEALVGTRVNAEALLADLRGNKGADTYSGIPGGPNSGLGVRLLAHATH